MSNLQAYLGADNPNEIKFNVQYSSEEECYWIYIGTCPIEKISCSKELLDYKMMIGRLFNAGYRPSKIKEVFSHDFRTIKKWANALLCDDIHEVIKAFEGRSCDAKLSFPLIRYVQQKYLQIKNTVYNYRQQIAIEVQSLFDQKLSTETLRKLFRQADRLAEAQEPKISAKEEPRNSESSENPLSDPAAKTAQNRSTTCSEEENPCVNLVKASKQSTQGALISTIPTGLDRATQPRKALQHVGMIFFSAFFDSYAQNRPDLVPAELQWLAQILQGAVNVEQSRKVKLFDLTQFTGKLPMGINSQREELHRIADIQRVIGIYQANSNFIKDGPNKGNIFYYDPTSKEYTGMHKTMKGWCGSSHGISKVMYLDAIHTESGRPCFIQHYSPYHDLRERFFTTLELFDQLFHSGKRQKRSFVIDRGIYGQDAFKRFKASGDYVLTWEKNYKKGAWDKERSSITFTKTRSRNSTEDRQEYHFSCQEGQWEKLEGMRRIIVLATNPTGRTIELSILCSNPTLDIKKATWLMFNRWLQENDFKYLNKHFGLDQLTSYKMKDFTEESIDEKEVLTAEYKDLKKAKSNNETQWKRLLLKSEQNDKKALRLQEEIKRATTNKEQRSLKRKLKTTEKNAKEYAELLAECSEKEEKYIEEISTTLMTKSKLAHLIENEFLQHDTRAKATMDALRITASNMFNLLVQHFRPLYNNFRNDHVMLRLLTQSDGFIEVTENQTIIYLWLKGSFQKHQLKVFEQFLSKMAHWINQYFSDRIKPLSLVIFKGDFS